MVRAYIVPAIGRMPLTKLAPEHVQAMLAELGDRRAPRTVALTRNVRRNALNRAERHGRVHRNVASLVDPPRVPRDERRPFTAEQARALLAAVEGRIVAPVIITAVGTGARQGELLALRWQDIDLDAGLAAIRHTRQTDGSLAEPKTERSRRVVWLPRTAVDALREHRRRQLQQRLASGPDWDGEDFVFTQADGRPMTPEVLRRGYYAVLADAGLPRLPFHHLRHAFATLQVEAGEDLASVSRMLGHSSVSVTADVYAHLAPSTQRRAAERMDDILTG